MAVEQSDSCVAHLCNVCEAFELREAQVSQGPHGVKVYQTWFPKIISLKNEPLQNHFSRKAPCFPLNLLLSRFVTWVHNYPWWEALVFEPGVMRREFFRWVPGFLYAFLTTTPAKCNPRRGCPVCGAQYRVHGGLRGNVSQYNLRPESLLSPKRA